jgi:hypothetical protein
VMNGIVRIANSPVKLIDTTPQRDCKRGAAPFVCALSLVNGLLRDFGRKGRRSRGAGCHARVSGARRHA